MVLDFLRLIDRPSTGSGTSNFLLQTAAVRYRLRDRDTRQPFTLDLLSTVHLAEPAYYSGNFGENARSSSPSRLAQGFPLIRRGPAPSPLDCKRKRESGGCGAWRLP